MSIFIIIYISTSLTHQFLKYQTESHKTLYSHSKITKLYIKKKKKKKKKYQRLNG